MVFCTSLFGTSKGLIFCTLGLLLLKCIIAEDPFKCPEQFGYYPDYQDCSKYYVCVFGDSLHEKCTGGLFFSIELQTCDWPRNVECANGDKPGETPVELDSDDDEVFSSSRRTSATATSNKQRSLNSEPISNYQSFETDRKKDNQRNNSPKVEDNQRVRSQIPDAKLNSKQPSTHTTNPSPKPRNPTTVSDRTELHNDKDEDPLYHGDERIKVSDPLGNYDPQQPEFDEAAPPLIDSEGGIHIADGGHGLDAFAGLSHLPGLGDYSVIAKPVYNSNNGKAEDGDYKIRERKPTTTRNSAILTKPRSLENLQSNARSKDPDVVIDYTNGKKELTWRQPQDKDFHTPPPTIFDDNADHRDYGRFDIITPLKTNIQADHDPNVGIDRVKIPSEITDAQLVQDVPRIPNRDKAKVENLRPNKEIDDIKTLNVGSDLTANKAQSTQAGKDFIFDVDHEIPRLVSNDEFLQDRPSIRNIDNEPEIVHSQRTQNKAQEKNAIIVHNSNYFNGRPENSHKFDLKENFDNSRIGDKTTASNYESDAGKLGQSNDEVSEYQRESNKQSRRTYTQDTRTGNHREKDSSIIEPIDEDFGIYTGNQRQNRKIDVNEDNENSRVIIPAESIQPSVRQPNQIRPLSNKDRNSDIDVDTKKDNHQFGGFNVHVDYGEYDSPKPHFTDDYFTSNEDEATTKSTTQLTRTRPTRPRKPITTTTTTTTTTTPAPIRVRSRRPINQVAQTGKPTQVTIPASPPSRPPSVYSTPIPYESSQKCDPRKCKLPDCRCGGTDIPGGILPEQTPQIVVLTFDDAVNELDHDLYNELFDSGRKNPNGCPILATFYVSHEWTDYGQVQTLYSKGHEIASHSITHSYGEKFSKNQWMREIQGQREILHLYGGVKMEDIRGMRAPFLQIGGNKMFEMLYDANFTYDSSMPVYENNPPFWPYTLDYALNHECMIFPCPSKNYPGLWEVGMVMWVDLRGGRCSMGDACSNPPDEETVSKMLMKNFNRHYKSNRAPFGLFYHSAWFNTQHHRRGFVKFLDEILAKDDVYLVTNWQLIQWMRQPVPVSKLRDFEPFNCRKVERPPPCPTPTVCNVWYQGGVRYMKTCQPCPVKYPWIGNTGYETKNRG